MENNLKFQMSKGQEASAMGLMLGVRLTGGNNQTPSVHISANFRPRAKILARQFGLGIQWVIDDSQRCLNFDDAMPVGVLVTSTRGDSNGQIKGFLRKLGSEFGQEVVLYQTEETWAAMRVKGPRGHFGVEIGCFSIKNLNTLVSLLLNQSPQSGDIDCNELASIETTGDFSIISESGYLGRWRLSLMAAGISVRH